MGVYPILGVLGAQPVRMVWVMMRKMVDDGEGAKMHVFLRKHGVKKLMIVHTHAYTTLLCTSTVLHVNTELAVPQKAPIEIQTNTTTIDKQHDLT